jgi:hypothetical protein
VTHGKPVMKEGREQFAAALRARPWSRQG